MQAATTNKIKTAILKMAQKIKNEYSPEKIILFGSYAWGRPQKDSDVDFFIIKDTKERHIDRSVRVAEILDRENADFAIEPLVYTPQEVASRLKIGDPFIGKILKKGQVLYG